MAKTPSSPPPGVTQDGAPQGYDRVVDYLVTQVKSGALKVGDRLLPERELAVRLNISRPIVREALRSLAMIGVLDIQQKRGTFVRSPDIAALDYLFTFMFAQSGEEIDDIVELRQALEQQAVRLACIRARSGDIERMAAALDRIKETVDDPVEGGRADFTFHTRLVEASHSPALIKIYGIVSRILEISHIARRRRLERAPGSYEFLVDQHALLFRAVQARDVEESARLLTAHFEIGEKLNSEAFARAAAGD